MSKVRVHAFSISLDGFGTGDVQTLDAPFGHAGERLHEWMFSKTSAGSVDAAMAALHDPGIGAEIMGRGKFGPQHGDWTNEEWKGWWGDNPPFHTPVFVLTHHPRASVEMEGGTVFHFLDAAPADAVAIAKEAAGGLDVRIGGGPTMLREFLAADLIDQMHVVLVPIVLGRGVRLWDGLDGLEGRFAIETVSSPSGVSHLTFERRRAESS